MDSRDDEEERQLRSVAIQNASSILLARQRAEQELIRAKEALERKTQELAHSLSMMRATLESTWDGILVTADDGSVTDFNEMFVRIWQIPREVMTSRQHRKLMEISAGQFNDPARFLAQIEAIYATSPTETNDLLELADGRVVERFSKVQLVDGRRVGRVWSFRDITERRRAEDALRDETRMLGLLNDTGKFFASKLDVRSLVQAVTDAATQLSAAECGAFFFNATDENGDAFLLDTLSGAPREAFSQFGEPRASPLFAPTFRGEPPIRCDDVTADPRYVQRQPQHGLPRGHLAVRSYLAVPVISRSEEVLGGLFFGHSQPGVFTERAERLIVAVAAQAAAALDNARLFESVQKSAEERKQLLESERYARSVAERASAMKDEFLATLSHELRSPLSAILGWSQVLRRGTRSEADLRKGLETIERNARVQTQLIEDLLDMSRIIAGKVRLDVQPIAPISFVEAAIETVRPAAEAKGIRIEKVLDPAAGPIAGDPNRLQQVIWNLVANAIKFTSKDGKVQVTLERVNSHVEITVSDTGIGIKPEFLPHVFERFRQADAATTRAYGGLGLGLSIVKHLVELHGGTVEVTSRGEGLGATFSVHLPLSAVHRHADAAERAHPRTPTAEPVEFKHSDLSGIKVLVVDDETDARALIARVLQECDANVLCAANAAQALALVEREKPDVLVSDVGMPDVDGFELLRRVRALGPAKGGTVPAVALTAFARSEDRTRALRAGFLVHVSKPVEPSELVATVATVAGRTGHGAGTDA